MIYKMLAILGKLAGGVRKDAGKAHVKAYLWYNVSIKYRE
jgi:hypothetical protein